jgi:putative aminopeptidase FrvX
MICFVREYIREHVPEAEVHMDSWGNLYIKKSADSSLYALHSSHPSGYPTLACHLDQVQLLHSEDFEVRQENGTLYGWSEQNQRREGLGADDKNGIWVCLRCLEECPHLKVFMAVGEEKGCIGSNHADMSFFADSLYVLEPDCKGGEEIHTNLKGVPCASTGFEQALLEADCSQRLSSRLGQTSKLDGSRCSDNSSLFTLHSSFSITPGKGSDIFALTLNGIGVSCANIPAGYHLPHKDDEYTVVAELEHTLAFIRHFVTTEHRRFPHIHKTYTQQMIEA